MPCRDDYGYADVETARAGRVACNLARIIRRFPEAWKKVEPLLTKETVAWIEEHDEEDRRREQERVRRADQEVKRQEVLSKLTSEEKEALGIR